MLVVLNVSEEAMMSAGVYLHLELFVVFRQRLQQLVAGGRSNPVVVLSEHDECGPDE